MKIYKNTVQKTRIILASTLEAQLEVNSKKIQGKKKSHGNQPSFFNGISRAASIQSKCMYIFTVHNGYVPDTYVQKILIYILTNTM
jgi:hypothetical protein